MTTTNSTSRPVANPMARRGGGIANPLAGIRGSSDPTTLLHPQGEFQGTVTAARVYSAGTGALTLEAQIQSDHHVEQEQAHRRMFKRYVFTGEGLVYTQQMLDSLGIDISEDADDEWQDHIVRGLVGRRVHFTVRHFRQGAEVQAQVRIMWADDQTRAQDRLRVYAEAHNGDYPDDIEGFLAQASDEDAKYREIEVPSLDDLTPAA